MEDRLRKNGDLERRKERMKNLKGGTDKER